MTPITDTPAHTEALAMRVLLVRLVTHRDLTAHEAARAVDQALRGEVGPHTHLVTLEVAHLLTETLTPARAVIEALRPIIETAARTMADLTRALAHAAHRLTTGNPCDRPAWASPYGPPPKRHN
ncbi:hypothetical protein [Streptomyces sp. H27-H5]|uniref:hypothetical protein n=1 Tax=Streptomyces sp. H27-H5 TaxID=2996460 RepID=UPI00227011B8|nr:hypothetical protein [Streptomyces sp. H27-H5]MCY0957683.1 hypothetical protein [Streptomyces sp. H27-H5]